MIDKFCSSYRPGKPTVVLLPGGMGSRLDRSHESYQDDERLPTGYDELWFAGMFWRRGRELQIDDNGHDEGDHVVRPKGPVSNLFDPYDWTKSFFWQSDVNYVVFAYDWRRRLIESARFLRYFLKHLGRRIHKDFGENPLPNVTLLGHSQGGLVAKLFLDAVRDVGSWIKQLVTVGTPFYGTWSHQQRYFIGQEILYDYHNARELAEIAATFPGPYTLMFLPRTIYDKYGEELGLKRYPMRNCDDTDGRDPYQQDDFTRYYPRWVKSKHLDAAREVCNAIAKPFRKDVAARVFNIRSVSHRTPVELVWRPLPTDFDPNDGRSPIVPTKEWGKGDGTVPRWAAFHASVPKDNKVELTDASKHMYLAEDLQVLDFVAERIKDKPTIPLRRTASARVVKTWLRKIAAEPDLAANLWRVPPEVRRGIYREVTK